MAFRHKYFFLRGGSVVSDEGFSVAFKDRAKIVYADELGTVLVSGEQMAQVGEWVLYANRMYVGATLKTKLEDEQRRTEIIGRVLAAAKYQGMTIEVDWSH